MLRTIAFATLLLCSLCANAGIGTEEPDSAPKKFSIAAHYTKYEYQIPMRDGVRLFTAVYVPKDQSTSWPFIMHRTL